jgi:hypothetical protein
MNSRTESQGESKSAQNSVSPDDAEPTEIASEPTEIAPENVIPKVEPSLKPLPYHLAVHGHLQEKHPDVWKWFTSGEFREQAADAIRLELLKTTYRLEHDLHGDLYTLAEKALKALDLDAPITLYQAQGDGGLNAFLAYLPGEAHVGFAGPILKHLTPEETLAILGHELTHYLFFTNEDRAGLTAEQILTAMANDTLGDATHEETARLYRLYTEILCDRGGYRVTGDVEVTIAALVKVTTGIAEVHAQSYLRQADEVLSSDGCATENTTHPEIYFRARALALWVEKGEAAEAEIARMIEGARQLDRLDLVRQAEVGEQTRQLLTLYLTPTWFQTEAVLAHARLFFPDFEGPKPTTEQAGDDQELPGTIPETRIIPKALLEDIKTDDEGMRNYLCYLLLDFIALAPELEEAPYAAAFVIADPLQLGDRLLEIARKELGVAKRELLRIRKNAPLILQKMHGGNV